MNMLKLLVTVTLINAFAFIGLVGAALLSYAVTGQIDHFWTGAGWGFGTSLGVALRM
jgi:hypothetical protein